MSQDSSTNSLGKTTVAIDDVLSQRLHAARNQGFILVLIGGGSAAGKTTFAKELADRLRNRGGGGEGVVVELIHMDAFHFRDELPKYYSDKHGDYMPDWNQPTSVDCLRLIANLNHKMKQQHTNNNNNNSSSDNDVAAPIRLGVVIVEGILALHFEDLLRMSQLRLFVHTDADERVIRRIRRNMRDRGMTFDEVADYYLESVRHRHQEYVEPTRQHADLIIHGGAAASAVSGQSVEQVLSEVTEALLIATASPLSASALALSYKK